MVTATQHQATAPEYNYPAFVRSTTVGMADVFRQTVRVGDVAPDFALTGLDGTTVRLSDLRGQHVVLEFGSIT